MRGTSMAEPRKHTEVAVGVLVRADGALLLSTRPPGKPYAGYWEFPGGKIEAGETVEQALRRELIEELGVTIDAAQVWKVTEHDYPHALERLHDQHAFRLGEGRARRQSDGRFAARPQRLQIWRQVARLDVPAASGRDVGSVSGARSRPPQGWSRRRRRAGRR